MLEGDEEGVGARVQLALSVAQAVVCLEEEEHRRRHTSGNNKGVKQICRGGAKERKLDALEHVHDLAEVLLGVAADLRAVGCGITLTQPAACSACSNHVAPRTIGEHRGKQGVVIANTKGVADLRGDGGDDD